MSAAQPTAALVIIGAEVLSAKVEDVNAPYLVRALRSRGVEVIEIRTIGDDVDTIAKAVSALAPRVDYLFTTGGIGPTHDDVTIAGVAAAFDAPVVTDRVIEERLRARLGSRLNAAHLKMADVPEGARVILDAEGLLPIVQMRNVTLFPGVPSLMRWCFERLASELRGPPFYTRAVLLSVPESSFADHLATVQKRHPLVTIGSYPRVEPEDLAHPRDSTPVSGTNTPRVRVKVTVDGRSGDLVGAAVADIRAGMPADWILGEEESVVGAA
jgi:molybdenum cofactor synthesis domain-containing protein